MEWGHFHFVLCHGEPRRLSGAKLKHSNHSRHFGAEETAPIFAPEDAQAGRGVFSILLAGTAQQLPVTWFRLVLTAAVCTILLASHDGHLSRRKLFPFYRQLGDPDPQSKSQALYVKLWRTGFVKFRAAETRPAVFDFGTLGF